MILFGRKNIQPKEPWWPLSLIQLFFYVQYYWFFAFILVKEGLLYLPPASSVQIKKASTAQSFSL